MLNIVLFGPPGAGKGTQSEILIKEFGLIHLSTGNLFRKHLGEGTQLGKMAQGYMDKGDLVPDDVVIEMVEEKVKNHLDAKGFIFDGFPRTVHQAEALDTMLAGHDLKITGMIALEVPEEELTVRLLERGKTSGRADDQEEAKIQNRIRVYNDETSPVADFYKNQGKFHSIHGVGGISEIAGKIADTISRFQ